LAGFLTGFSEKHIPFILVTNVGDQRSILIFQENGDNPDTSCGRRRGVTFVLPDGAGELYKK